MELRPRLHQANGGELRWDFPRGLFRKSFGRVDRRRFSERTLKTFTDQDEAETAHPRARYCLILWDAFVMAMQSNFQSRLLVRCPGWGKDGRMNQGRFHAYFS
jgi:hypothetical protein